jgi:hypothetical protein
MAAIREGERAEREIEWLGERGGDTQSQGGDREGVKRKV